jgi:predicted nucleotidyltransferase component of viral defense system
MTNYGARYYQKLQDLSRSQGIDMQTLVRLYAQQRLLYRISVSDVGAEFCLKGGLMLAAYNGGELFRSTDDIDLNGFGIGGIDEIERAIRIAIAAPVPEDGVAFDGSSLTVKKDRGEGIIPGGKVQLVAQLHTARIPLAIDVGFGNVITPFAEEVEIPTLLSDLLPSPRVYGYPLETIVAEKLHAMAQHGLANTRLKDYYDVWRIQSRYDFEGSELSKAITATFRQQDRKLVVNMPALSDAFALRGERDWKAFLKKTVYKDEVTLSQVMPQIREFLVPPMETALGLAPAMDWFHDRGWLLPVREMEFDEDEVPSLSM